MIEIIKILEARALDDHRIWIRFSNGKQGVHDFADVLADGGGMVEPLRDSVMFRWVFLEFDTLAWPTVSVSILSSYTIVWQTREN